MHNGDTFDTPVALRAVSGARRTMRAFVESAAHIEGSSAAISRRVNSGVLVLPMRSRMIVSTALALLLVGGAPGSAAAGERRLDACVAVPTIAAPTPVGPAAGEGDMEAASLAFAEAERSVASDPERAIAGFEAGLAAVPPGPGYAPTRARVLLQIVAAHEVANTRDGGGQLGALCRGHDRLHRAKALLDHYLGPLGLLDEEGRASVEARRVGLREAIAAAGRRILREQAVRDAARARLAARVRTTAGIVVLGGGALGLGLMGAAISVGRSTDQKLEACLATDLTCDGKLADYRKRGSAANVAVLAGALTAGTLLVTGAVLVILGNKQRARAKALERGVRAFDVGPAPMSASGRWGPGIVIQGRF